jgi:hypothetical protein
VDLDSYRRAKIKNFETVAGLFVVQTVTQQRIQLFGLHAPNFGLKLKIEVTVVWITLGIGAKVCKREF